MRRFTLTLLVLFFSVCSFAQVGAINGTLEVCTGFTTALTDTTPSGTWSSSNPSIATIGSSSGIVTGITTGIVTITYTAGSSVTANVTVNASPASITGPSSFCNGSGVTLGDITPGGTWSSSNPAIANVGPTTGYVTGVSPGMVTILYTLSNGCSAASTLSVNTSPSPISGPTSVCSGSVVALTNSTSGGTWSSSVTAVATIGTGSGFVTGITAGTAVITYTLSTGCSTSTFMTVNPLPSSTSGPSYVCPLGNITLSNPTSGGTWSSSNVAVASVSAGTVTGNSAGAATIFYTLSTGCSALKSVTVNALPTSHSISSVGTSYCAGGSGVVIGLMGSQAGVNYQLYLGASAVGTAVTGTGAAISFGTVMAAGTYTAVATNTSTTCSTNMSGSVNVSIDPLPSAYTVTGSDTVCAGGSGVAVGLSGSSSGINYQLYLGGSPVGSPLSGTGSPLSLGSFTTAGAYTVTATNPVTGCTNAMSGSAVVTIHPAPIVYTVTGGGAYCTGTTGSHVHLGGSDASISYQLFNGGAPIGGPVTGTGTPIDFGPQTIAGTYTIVATNTTTACSQNMTGSATVSVSALPAAFTVTASGSSFCSGGAGINVTLVNSTIGVSYQLYNGSTPAGSPLGGTGMPLDFGYQTTGGTYTIVGTNVSTSCSTSMTGSAVIAALPAPTIYAVTGGGAYCAGSSGVNVGIAGSQTGIDYQLYTGTAPFGSVVPGSGFGVSMGMLTIPGTYTVKATNPSTGCSAMMSGTAVVAISPLPSVYTVTGGGSFCAGGAGMPVAMNNSDAGISYQLMRGTSFAGLPVTGTGSSISFGLQTIGGTYTVIATNTTTGCTNTMGGTAVITVNPLPTIHNVTGGGAYCSGGAGVNIGLGSSNTGINYQLYHGTSTSGMPATGTGSAMWFGLRTSPGTYTVVAANVTTGCSINMTGSATVSITSLVTPTVSMNISPNDSVCAGTTVTFTTTTTGGGTSPVYSWMVNGVPASPSASYSYNPANGDVVTIVMNSSAPCPFPTSVSASATMTVFSTPTITGASSACVGSTTTLSGPAGCTWSSSSPSVAVISTIGISTGVLTGLSAGTSVITCTLGGCISTQVVTVNTTPTVTVSSTGPACGGSFTLNATGGATYSWLPAAGLACSSCGTTTARPLATTTYTVTGNATTGCSNTATVSINGNRISGHISYTGSSSDVFKVWLIQFNASDSSLVAEDSVLTCMSGGTPYFEFYDMPSGNYMVKAKLIGTIPGTSGYIPTYSLSTPYWYAAASIAHGSGTDTAHINMIYGTVPAGPGFIGGLISMGAGKGTSGEAPAAGLLVYLKDAFSGLILTSTYTDAAGAYSFRSIAHGNYIICPEAFAYRTTPSAVISIAAGTDSATSVNFREYTTSRVITPFTENSITAISGSNGAIDIYPNPTSGLLHIKWNSKWQEPALVTVTDITGRAVHTASIEITAAQNQATVDLGDLKSGVYLITIKSENIFYSSRLMVQE